MMTLPLNEIFYSIQKYEADHRKMFILYDCWQIKGKLQGGKFKREGTPMFNSR